MSAEAVGWCLKLDLQGDHTMKLVLAAFCDSADGKTFQAWPGDPYVAQVAECSTRTVQRKREKLEQLGLLKLEQRHWRGQTHLYAVNVGGIPDWDATAGQAPLAGVTDAQTGTAARPTESGQPDSVSPGQGVQPEQRPDTAPTPGQPDSDTTATGHAPDIVVSQQPDTTVSERPDTQMSDEPLRTIKNRDPGTGPDAPSPAGHGAAGGAGRDGEQPAKPVGELPPGRFEGSGAVVVEILMARASDPVFRARASMLAEYAPEFPALDIAAELRAIARWNVDHPAKRKTREGMRRHITAWLKTAQNDPRKRATGRAASTRAPEAPAAPRPCVLKCGRPADGHSAGVGPTCSACRLNLAKHGRQWRPEQRTAGVA